MTTADVGHNRIMNTNTTQFASETFFRPQAIAWITQMIERRGGAGAAAHDLDGIFDECFVHTETRDYGFQLNVTPDEFADSVESHKLEIITVVDPSDGETEEVPVFDTRIYRRASVYDDGRHYPAEDLYVEIAQTPSGEYLRRSWVGETTTPDADGWCWVGRDADELDDVRRIVTLLSWERVA